MRRRDVVVRAGHALEGAVPLGQLLSEPSCVPVPEWVDEDERPLEMPQEHAASIDGIHRRIGGAGVVKALRPTVVPDSRELVLRDAVFAPFTNVDVINGPVNVIRAAAGSVWHIGYIEHERPETELQSAASLRRIWTRELLTLRRCELGHEAISWKLARLLNEPPQFESMELTSSTDFQPQMAQLWHLDAKTLPSASAVRGEDIRPPVAASIPATRLIGPKLRVEYDLEPLPPS